MKILEKMLNFFLLNFGFSIGRSYVGSYPAPRNIGYLWNFGMLAIFFLMVQMLTGLFLAMFYTPHIDLAFFSIEHIMNDISYGWLIRYLHANGASFFFFIVYMHMLRGLYYASYQSPSTNLWISGVTIYFMLMAAAFFGYVLPWGQMSFWAVTVITNLLTVFPYIGDELVYWIWGGYSINNATLNRFFCLHFLLPFILFMLVVIHLVLLHQVSSTTELRIKPFKNTKMSFFPYFIIKDLFTICIVLMGFSIIVFYYPELFNHAINYVSSNPLVTPSHIVPEWYFLPFYAMLSSMSNKTLGIMAMFLSLAVFFMLPILDPGHGVSSIYMRVYSFFFWMFVLNFICLGFLGSQTAEYPCAELGLFCTMMHLSYFFIFLPMMSSWESFILLLNTTDLAKMSTDSKLQPNYYSIMMNDSYFLFYLMLMFSNGIFFPACLSFNWSVTDSILLTWVAVLMMLSIMFPGSVWTTYEMFVFENPSLGTYLNFLKTEIGYVFVIITTASYYEFYIISLALDVGMDNRSVALVFFFWMYVLVPEWYLYIHSVLFK